MTDELRPGDRWPGESARAHEAARAYLELGVDRSTAEVARRLGKSKTLMDRWSSRWQWVRRAREWDHEHARIRDAEHLDALAAAAKRQATEARVHAGATIVVAQEVLRRQRDDRTWVEKLSAEELLRLEAQMARAHNRAVLTERMALGMTTEQAGEPVPRSEAEELARRLTDDELDARLVGVDELAERRARKAGGEREERAL